MAFEQIKVAEIEAWVFFRELGIEVVGHGDSLEDEILSRAAATEMLAGSQYLQNIPPEVAPLLVICLKGFPSATDSSAIQVLAWGQECRSPWNAENEAAARLLRFGLAKGGLLASDFDSSAGVRWPLGELKILPLLGGGQGHSVAARGSPDLGQDVLAAIMMENQLFRLLGGRLRPDQSLHGCACLEVADRDEVGPHLSVDDVVAGRHLRLSYLESKRDMGSSSGLRVGSGGGEQERQNHKR
jgi:hypothetical protein